MTERRLEFPDNFLWGSATASYQIEGGVNEGGRGPSIWDTFSHTPGNVLNGDTGDVANDHFHRFRDDVAMMADLGLQSYRFSIAWPRIQPTGSGAVNHAGLDFYKQLVDALKSSGIEPWITLYHWDLPQALEDEGGWVNRATAERFADYASIAHHALGDSVRYWTTMNEPWCSAFLGYGSGRHAPGRQEPASAIHATHNLLLGHGLAVSALRAAGADSVGITLNLTPCIPNSQSEVDVDAARRIDGISNRIFLDPLLRGTYPADVRADLEAAGIADGLIEADLPVISQPIDVLGVNYYFQTVAIGGGTAPVNLEFPGSEAVTFGSTGRPVTAMGWEISPEVLGSLLRRLRDEYPFVPLFITENGAAFWDEVGTDGEVDDQNRVEFLREHLLVCREAIDDGVPLEGYFVWSLMDNFEWALGYERRFGIVYVDYETQQRIPKASAKFYSDVIANGLPLD